jgi:hypothetical protein
MPKRPSEPAVRYVVSRLNWRRTPAGFVRLPGEVRVASFDTIQEAEAERRRREADAREQVNPFASGLAPYEQTSLPPGIFRDWLLDAGIEPPPEPTSSLAWAAWWEKQSPTWTADQRARAWEALDKTRFFAVEERPRRPVVYAVVSVTWNYNDQWYYANGEGGKVMDVYRSRERAEDDCALSNELAREQWAEVLEESGEPLEGMFDVFRREEAASDPFAAPLKPGPSQFDDSRQLGVDTAPFYEVVEVELEDGE